MDYIEGKTTSGIVRVYPTKIVIKYSRFLGSGRGEKEIRISSLSGIQIKKPGLLAGFIEFSFSGGKEPTGSMFIKDENRLIINNKKQYEEMLLVKAAIENNLNNKAEHMTQTINQLSQADELEKFAKLRDSGIINQDEFEAKKKSILGL